MKYRNFKAEDIEHYRKEMADGRVRRAYSEIVKYMIDLRNQFSRDHEGYFTGNLYQGYMDISFFEFTLKRIKAEKLKVALVFKHETVAFEIWLVGATKKVQREYWEMFSGSDWDAYPVSASAEHSILEYVLDPRPDFSELGTLTEKIERKLLEFNGRIREVLGLD